MHHLKIVQINPVRHHLPTTAIVRVRNVRVTNYLAGYYTIELSSATSEIQCFTPRRVTPQETVPLFGVTVDSGSDRLYLREGVGSLVDWGRAR